jgi:hypothetical protein
MQLAGIEGRMSELKRPPWVGVLSQSRRGRERHDVWLRAKGSRLACSAIICVLGTLNTVPYAGSAFPSARLFLGDHTAHY